MLSHIYGAIPQITFDQQGGLSAAIIFDVMPKDAQCFGGSPVSPFHTCSTQLKGRQAEVVGEDVVANVP